MMRLGLSCFVFASVIVWLYFLIDEPRVAKKDEIKAMVTSCSLNDTGLIGEVKFYGKDENGYAFRQTQNCTYGGYYFYQRRCNNGRAYRYVRYSITDGEDYISYHNRLFVKQEYYWANPGTPLPVPVWCVPIALALMVMFFYMGKKQINVSMKYPRTDVPEELSGAPVIVNNFVDYDGNDIRQEAEAALSHVKERAKRPQRDPIHTPPPEEMFDSVDINFKDRP